jgi:hypothetical protein
MEPDRGIPEITIGEYYKRYPGMRASFGFQFKKFVFSVAPFTGK